MRGRRKTSCDGSANNSNKKDLIQKLLCCRCNTCLAYDLSTRQICTAIFFSFTNSTTFLQCHSLTVPAKVCISRVSHEVSNYRRGKYHWKFDWFVFSCFAKHCLVLVESNPVKLEISLILPPMESALCLELF